MSKKTLILIVSIMAIIVVGIFIFAYLRQMEMAEVARLVIN